MDKFTGMKAFVAAVEAGSFTAAADRLYLSKKLISKYIGQLEDDLGVRLFHRTTRRLSLSSAGKSYYPDCLRILEEIETSEQALRQSDTGLTGPIRMTAPLGYGVLQLQDVLLRFQTENPNISFDLNLTDAFTNIAQEGYDLAIRIGILEDSSLVARRLAKTAFWLVAAPEYIARSAPLAHPSDLQAHTCILDTNFRNGHAWSLNQSGQTFRHEPQGPFRVNSANAAMRLAQAGHGLAMLPDYIAKENVSTGSLARVLTDFDAPQTDVNAVFLERRYLPRRVVALIEYLQKALR